MEMSNAIFNQTDPLMPSKALVLAHLDPHSVYHCPLDSYTSIFTHLEENSFGTFMFVQNFYGCIQSFY